MDLEEVSDSEYQAMERLLNEAVSTPIDTRIRDIEDAFSVKNPGDASDYLINQVRGRKGILWVTDLCSVEWCELQNQYQVHKDLHACRRAHTCILDQHACTGIYRYMYW
jgi:hypothetical protein